MKKLLIVLAAMMASQAQAGIFGSDVAEDLKTTIRCIAKDDVNTAFHEIRLKSGEGEASTIKILDYTFVPTLSGDDKNLVVLKKGTSIEEDFQVLQFGISKSSAMTLPITMNDGRVFYCNMLLQRIPAAK